MCHVSSTHCQYWSRVDYILCSWRWRRSIQSAETTSGADYGSDHELLIAKLRHKLNKVRKTTRPFSYDLNQILYDYTEEVTNRFKGLDLIDETARRTTEGGSWLSIWGGDQNHPQEKEMQKGKMVFWGGLQIAEKWEAKGKGDKERHIHLNAELQRTARKD